MPTQSGLGGYYLIDVQDYANQGTCYVQLSVTSTNFYWLGRVYISVSVAYFINDWFSSCTTNYASYYGRLYIVITPSTGPLITQVMNYRIIG